MRRRTKLALRGLAVAALTGCWSCGDRGADGNDAGPDRAGCPEGSNVGEPRAPTLAEPVATEVEGTLDDIRVGDLNADGLDDVALLVNPIGESKRVSILPADGAGGFGDRIDLGRSEERFPVSLEIADLDGDGEKDLVVGYGLADPRNPGIESVFWGGSDFPGVATDLEGDGSLFGVASVVASGDIDGDDQVDLVALQSGLAMFVSYGRGNREFEAGRMLYEDDLATAVLELWASDVDQDGLVEPISRASDLDTPMGFRTYHVDGDRGVSVRQIAYLSRPQFAVSFEDLDRDGAPDILFAGPHSVSVLWNRGDGDFHTDDSDDYCTTMNPTLQETSPSIAVADLDGDGRTDIATVDERTSELVFLMGREDRHLHENARLPSGQPSPRAAVAGDFDGDGRQDLAVVHMARSAVGIDLLVHLSAGSQQQL